MKIEKQFIVDCSDKRNEFLYQLLLCKGYNTKEWNKNQTLTNAILLLSPQTTIVQDAKDSIVFYWNIDEQNKKSLLQQNNTVYQYSQDENLATLNSQLCAEGVLAKVITNTQQCLNTSCILVLGSGRLARSICQIFYNNNCYVDVVAKYEQHNSILLMFCKNVYDLHCNIDYTKYHCIINTIPSNVFSKQLVLLKKDCFVLDLASGNSMYSEQCKLLNLSHCHYLGIPGKVAPRTAAKILLQSVLARLQ